MLIAFTRAVPRSIVDCELTHIDREPIDWARAVEQHRAYEDALRSLGCEVRRVAAAPDHPDSVFIEDTAIVLDECAIITRPGALSRRGEVNAVADALRVHRELRYVGEPATLDGGDVLRVGKRLWVGLSTRSNAAGARHLADALAPFGYRVDTIAVRGALHLKSVVSALPDGRVLLDPQKIDARTFGAGSLCIHPDESIAANVLAVDDTVLVPAAAPRTCQLLEHEGYAVLPVDASELAKAEGGLTCCSLLLRG